jgi:hypothetical protein
VGANKKDVKHLPKLLAAPSTCFPADSEPSSPGLLVQCK